MPWASWLVNRPNLVCFMAKDFILDWLEGSHEPKSIEEVLRDYFRSNEPLAVGYRKYLATIKKGGNYGNK